MFSRISDGKKKCSDCARLIPRGAEVVEDDTKDYRRCHDCQFKANFNPWNQSATINPDHY